MFLAYKDLTNLFPQVKGIRDNHITFHTVASFAEASQPKGLFIPFENYSGELSKAIENGAIAAIWESDKDIPRYTPNHFPIFFTNDLMKGLKDMMELYVEKLNQTTEVQKDITNFLFYDEIRLKENQTTYDIAVFAERIRQVSRRCDQERGK